MPRRNLRAPWTATSMKNSQVRIAPAPKTIRPKSVAVWSAAAGAERRHGRREMTFAGPNETQVPVMASAATMVRPIRYCVTRSESGACRGQAAVGLRVRHAGAKHDRSARQCERQSDQSNQP